jgi:hypothetical protein
MTAGLPKAFKQFLCWILVGVDCPASYAVGQNSSLQCLRKLWKEWSMCLGGDRDLERVDKTSSDVCNLI